MITGKDILIADAGGTGTRWCLFDSEGYVRRDLHAAAINACVMNDTDIFHALQAAEVLIACAGDIYFYGAGCVDSEECERVEAQIRKLGYEGNVQINSDMIGAARALFGDNPGIACILGTGSNSCFYNGKTVLSHISPLGYILGDEGSGAAIGKRFFKKLLRNELSEEIKEKFFAENDFDISDIYERVYRQPYANMFLASQTRFIGKHINSDDLRKVIEEEFDAFFQNILCKYEINGNVPVAFMGSVAYCFDHILRTTASRYGVNVTKIDKDPLRGLLEYHTQIKK